MNTTFSNVHTPCLLDLLAMAWDQPEAHSLQQVADLLPTTRHYLIQVAQSPNPQIFVDFPCKAKGDISRVAYIKEKAKTGKPNEIQSVITGYHAYNKKLARTYTITLYDSPLQVVLVC
jgi:hypothetical protein